MKNYLFAFAILCTFNVMISQTSDNIGFTQRNVQDFANASAGRSAFGGAIRFVNPKRDTKGSIHLLSSWENLGVLVTNDGQKYKVDNININLKNQSFESRFKRDSLFTYNFNNLDRFIINNRVFKNYFYDEDNRIYEIIYESEDFSVLKGFKLDLVEGSANPMLNRKDDKYIQKKAYYLKAENSIKPFKLKKKKILRLAAPKNEEMRAKIEAYAKENGLSFKKDYDVNKILQYSKSL